MEKIEKQSEIIFFMMKNLNAEGKILWITDKHRSLKKTYQSFNPFPFKIFFMFFSIRASRVLDCLAEEK